MNDGRWLNRVRRRRCYASGETEQRAVPHLVAHLRENGIEVRVRIPARNRALSVEMAYNLTQASRYDLPYGPPDKYVILVDVDGNPPDQVLAPFKENLPGRLDDQLRSRIQYAYAQRHLEAWYFTDVSNLRAYLGGRALGNVDPSQPDDIENPKLHLKHLLGERVYTARISEDIAKSLNAQTIAERSPSFRGFLETVKNGTSHTATGR